MLLHEQLVAFTELFLTKRGAEMFIGLEQLHTSPVAFVEVLIVTFLQMHDAFGQTSVRLTGGGV
jgi:hypothetical protein